ncbi:UpxY family transcription antiterminator [Phocaeicola sp.]
MTIDKEKHPSPLRWYAAKTGLSVEKKIKKRLEKLKVEHFIPFRTVIKERNGKRIKLEQPVIPNLIFIHSDYTTCLSLVNDYGLAMNYLLDLEKHTLLVVPDKQMEDFMFLLDFSEEAVLVLNESLRQGDRVRVIKGDFAGIEGELVRIKGHKRVVVRLEGLFSLATTYIPSAYLEKI